MKKFYLSMMFTMLAGSLMAQTNAVIGAGALSGTSSNGATGDPGPMYRSSATSSFDHSRHHYLYTQAELQAEGILPNMLITDVAWFKANTAASNHNFLFQIWMMNSTRTSVRTPPQTNANLVSGATQVYNNAATSLSSATGFVNYSLSTPFLYTGGALEITVNFDISSGSSPWTTAGISWKKDNISNRTISYCGSTPNTSLGNARTVRPQIRITYEPAICNGTPNVASVSGVNGICSDSVFTLIATGSSNGTGISYRWQIKAPSSGQWVDVPGATDTFLTTSVNVSSIETYQYRFVTDCSGSGLSSQSIPFDVEVYPFPEVTGITESHNGPTYTFTGVGVQHATGMHWDYGDGFMGSSNVHTYSAGGIYNVTLTVSNPCQSAAITLPFTIFIQCDTPTAGYLDELASVTCEGDTILLEAIDYTSGFDIAYQWQQRAFGGGSFTDIPGETDAIFPMVGNENMEYRLLLTCTSSGLSDMTNAIPVKVAKRPVVSDPEDITVHQFQNAVFSVTSPGEMYYRWQSTFDGAEFFFVSENGVYSGVNSPDLTIHEASDAQTGMQFRCIVVDTTACAFENDTSGTARLIVLDPTSVGSYSGTALDISIYPNPVADDYLFLRRNYKAGSDVNIRITDAAGRLIQEQRLQDRGTTKLNLSSLAPGSYNLQLTDMDAQQTRALPFIKH